MKSVFRIAESWNRSIHSNIMSGFIREALKAIFAFFQDQSKISIGQSFVEISKLQDEALIPSIIRLNKLNSKPTNKVFRLYKKQFLTASI